MILVEHTLFKDTNGDQIGFFELVERLKYRQDKRRKTGLLPDQTLNMVVCWNGHFEPIARRLETCQIEGCGVPIKYRIVKGVLVKGLKITRPSNI